MGNNTGKAFARGGVRDDVARVVHPPSPQLMTATLVWHCSKLPMGRGLSKHDALALDKPLSARAARKWLLHAHLFTTVLRSAIERTRACQKAPAPCVHETPARTERGLYQVAFG